MAVVLLSSRVPSDVEGIKQQVSNESLQAVKRDALHAEGLLYGAEANVS